MEHRLWTNLALSVFVKVKWNLTNVSIGPCPFYIQNLSLFAWKLNELGLIPSGILPIENAKKRTFLTMEHRLWTNLALSVFVKINWNLTSVSIGHFQFYIQNLSSFAWKLYELGPIPAGTHPIENAKKQTLLWMKHRLSTTLAHSVFDFSGLNIIQKS